MDTYGDNYIERRENDITRVSSNRERDKRGWTSPLTVARSKIILSCNEVQCLVTSDDAKGNEIQVRLDGKRERHTHDSVEREGKLELS